MLLLTKSTLRRKNNTKGINKNPEYLKWLLKTPEMKTYICCRDTRPYGANHILKSFCTRPSIKYAYLGLSESLR